MAKLKATPRNYEQAAIAQPTSGEDEGFNVKVVYNKYGITLEPTANLLNDVQGIGESIPKPSIWELMEDFFTNGWERVNPEDIGALTSGEIMSDQDGNVYWHERYQIEDMVEELMNGNKVNLQYGGNLFEMDGGSEITPPAEKESATQEDPDRKDWEYEVANGDTKLGFSEWTAHQLDAHNHDYVRAITAQENQKLARIQIMDALQTVVEAFENGSLQETVTRTVYAKAKAALAALAREFEARL
jgi:hypothetical protein